MPLWKRAEPDRSSSDLHIVVGLGNPGSRYADTRHNVGFMAVQRLADRHGLSFRGSKQHADVARGVLVGQEALLAMPLTYMNESGVAVARLLRYYHVHAHKLLVVCDDLDLPFGRLRLRLDGSSGGNNGLKSIIHSIGTQDFARLRVGVGRPHKGAIGHVLSPFSSDEMKALPVLLDAACDAVEAVLTEGVEPAMNRFNRDWLPELPG